VIETSFLKRRVVTRKNNASRKPYVSHKSYMYNLFLIMIFVGVNVISGESSLESGEGDQSISNVVVDDVCDTVIVE
jgi:hypothetical protein